MPSGTDGMAHMSQHACVYYNVQVVIDGYGNIVCDPSHVERAMRWAAIASHRQPPAIASFGFSRIQFQN